MTTKQEYKIMVEKSSTNSNIITNCAKAFFIGGAICLIGQALINLYMSLNIPETLSKTAASITLIFLGAFVTAFGFYDNIAKHAGAGTLVPITGFSNAITSPAIEFKSEGWILGLGAKMFAIAGPVLVYGIIASAIYGVLLWILNLCGFSVF